MAFMGKCNTVHPGKCNLKHRHPKGGRILESSNARGDLRVKLDMNLQYDLTAWPASAVVLFREGRIWEREGRSPSCQGSDHTRSWVSGHWEGIENKNELRKKERVGWHGVSMGRNAIKTPTPHFLKVSGTKKVLLHWTKISWGWLQFAFSLGSELCWCEPQGVCCQKVRRFGPHCPELATHTTESLQTPWPGHAGAVPNKATAQSQFLLASQREVRSPATQDPQAGAMGSPTCPALPQQELGAVRNSYWVSREPEAGPGHQGGSPDPSPHAMAEMHFTDELVTHHDRGEQKPEFKIAPFHTPPVTKWVKKGLNSWVNLWTCTSQDSCV